MKPFWPLFLVFVSFNSLGAQEAKHAPTVEQCRADQKLWLSESEQTSDNLDRWQVSFIELMERIVELKDCRAVDPGRQTQYYNAEAETAAVQDVRIIHFLQRHNLWNQLLAEDARGKR